MDDTTPSAVLARQVRDQILFKPDTHQQDVAGMGEVVGTVELGGRHLGLQLDVLYPTRACVAGWACHLSGDEMVVPQRGRCYSTDENDRETWESWLRWTYPDDRGPARASAVWTTENNSAMIGDRAAELMDLDDAERRWLFADQRTRNEVLHGLGLLGKGDRIGFRLYADIPKGVVTEP